MPRSLLVLAVLAVALRCSSDHSDDPDTSSTASALSYPPNMVLPLEGQVGVLPGSGSVSPDGSYHYELPIEVPPGRRGMAPRLSLSYSSRGGNGLLGVGWQVSGLSMIRRCAQSFAFDGRAYGVTYGSNDDLCWEGHHIVAAADGTRWLDDDNSTRVQIAGDSSRITFTQNDGTRFIFSSTPSGSSIYE